MTDTMREEFENVPSVVPWTPPSVNLAYSSWQAACASQQAKLDETRKAWNKTCCDLEHERDEANAKIAELKRPYSYELLNFKIAELEEVIRKLREAIEQFTDPEGNPPEDIGEWRYAMKVLAETAPIGKEEK